jgi:hypothetical protein
MKRIISIIALSSLVAAAAFAQTVDGVVSPGEYPTTVAVDSTKVSYALSADGGTVFVAFEATTAGWVSVGLGSQRMSGAYMVMGYVDNGVASITEETGKGHGHSVNKDAKLLASAATEKNGVTTLEFSVPAKDFASSLPVVLAFGKKDNRTSMHSWFGNATLQLR